MNIQTIRELVTRINSFCEGLAQGERIDLRSLTEETDETNYHLGLFVCICYTSALARNATELIVHAMPSRVLPGSIEISILKKYGKHYLVELGPYFLHNSIDSIFTLMALGSGTLYRTKFTESEGRVQECWIEMHCNAYTPEEGRGLYWEFVKLRTSETYGANDTQPSMPRFAESVPRGLSGIVEQSSEITVRPDAFTLPDITNLREAGRRR